MSVQIFFFIKFLLLLLNCAIPWSHRLELESLCLSVIYPTFDLITFFIVSIAPWILPLLYDRFFRGAKLTLLLKIKVIKTRGDVRLFQLNQLCDVQCAMSYVSISIPVEEFFWIFPQMKNSFARMPNFMVLASLLLSHQLSMCLKFHFND